MLIRGGQLMNRVFTPDYDPMWSPADYALAATLEARLQQKGIHAIERHQLILCAVVKKKWPETIYTSSIESRLKELLII